jgi:shikimate dehydrogenase
VPSATVVVRDPARAEAAVACAAAVGVKLEVVAWASADFAALAETSVVVNTAPPDAVSPEALRGAPFLLDVIYHPWPTPLATAVASRGGRVATGLDMLLHQAFGQVEQFTGLVAPRQAMRDALHAATGGILPLPL